MLSGRPGLETVSKKKAFLLLMEMCFFLTYFLIGGLLRQATGSVFRSGFVAVLFFHGRVLFPRPNSVEVRQV